MLLTLSGTAGAEDHDDHAPKREKTVTGGDVSGPGDESTADQKAQALAKFNGVPDHSKVTASTYRAGIASSDPPNPTIRKKYLYVKHYAQNAGHWCGPAAGRMMLKNMNEGRSAYNGDNQWQVNLAKWAHMQTDYYGATKWDKDSFRRGINRWREGKTDGWYITLDSPSPEQFRVALGFTVEQYERPFAADTVEWQYTTSYNGHNTSNGHIGHWIVISAFGNYGNRTGFKDPATSVWPETQPSFWWDTDEFVNTWLQTNGIVW